MTREDILRMGIETDLFIYNGDDTSLTVWLIPTEEKFLKFASLVAAAEKELIAQWVESWGNDLTIKEIVEGIRTDGNGTTRPLKHVTREEPL